MKLGWDSKLWVQVLMVMILLLSIRTWGSSPEEGVKSSHPEFSLKKSIEKAEQWDRQVDQVALQSQEAAIRKLQKLVVKYSNSREEAGLLMRLADVLQESATIEFRISYARAHQNKTAASTNKYKSLLTSEIETLNRLIQKYPNFYSIDHGIFMRAKAYEELEDKVKAKADYLNLVHHFPKSVHATPSYMALADISIASNQHSEAIGYLKEVEKWPENPLYPFALYKLAWSSFNLKNYPDSLKYVETHIQYYDQILKNKKKAQSSDIAIRENSLLDSVVFFTEANEALSDRYRLSSALDYLKKLESGSFLGKMILRMAKILRSHRRDDDLVSWKNQLLKEERSRPETIEVLMSLFEHQLNQGQFDKLNGSLTDIRDLYVSNKTEIRESESYQSAKKLLSDTAISLQSRLDQLKGKGDVSPLLKTLSTLYTIFIQLLPETDPRLIQAHYNLAEIHFQSGEFENATQNYRWVISNWNDKSNLKINEKSNLKLSDVKLKAIASRYESLRQTKWMPTEINALPLDDNKPEDLGKNLPTQAKEWIDWIDTLVAETKESSDALDNFEFEANRAIYVHGGTRIAANRLIRFALKKPQSRFGVPAATLVVDTCLKSGKWTEGYQLISRFLKTPWNNPAFLDKLNSVAADFAYKIAESYFQSKDYPKAISQANLLCEKFPRSPRAADGILLIANSYLAIQDKENAKNYLTRLIQEFPQSKGKDVALLSRASLSEESYDLKVAINDYEAYLNLAKDAPSSKTSLDLQKRIYFLKWVNGERNLNCATIKSNSDSPSVELDLECEKFQAAAYLKMDPLKVQFGSDQSKFFYQRAMNGQKDQKAIWSAVSLKFDSNLKIREQLNLLRNLGKGWESLDPMIRFSLLPILNQVLPESFAKARSNLKKEVPLNRATSQAITRRAEWIKEYESYASTAMSLPWIAIRARILHELSGVYSDFSNTLSTLPIPKDIEPDQAAEYAKGVKEIVEPFMAKSKDIASKAIQLASTASVEDQVLNPIVESFPDLWKKQTDQFRKKLPQVKIEQNIARLDLNLLKLFKLQLDQSSSQNPRPADFRLLFTRWMESYQTQSWEKNAYFLQELKSKKEINSDEAKLLQGLVLIASGAQAEGLVELKDLASSLDNPSRKELDQMLLSYYARTQSTDISIQLYEEVDRLNVKVVSAQSGGRS